ncbi:MAG TPA: beta-ketoacyl-ACP reductase [Candidatus Acidoferrales bacterium]|nr:beta-ketoacyl-ACP reductase [Candidatus Acidoferrales bacterium]
MFKGRVAIVTGGTRGIGLAITEALAQEHAHVAAGYSRGAEAAEKCAEQHRAKGQSVSTHQGRVDDFADCQRVVNEVLEKYGRIDFLINNAGITLDKTLRKMSAEDWCNVINVNLSGAFNMTKAVLEHMIERGSGRVINISSVIGQTGNIGQANYAASKAGLFGFTKSLALETANKGITANVVAPGFIGTEMVAAMPEAALAKVVEKIPTKRLGKPEEVARVVKFLCEDDSGYITGAAFHVNGGLDMS